MRFIKEKQPKLLSIEIEFVKHVKAKVVKMEPIQLVVAVKVEEW